MPWISAVPVPVIDMAVSMRDLSAYKEERMQAAALYKSAQSMKSLFRMKYSLNSLPMHYIFPRSFVMRRDWQCCIKLHPNWKWRFHCRKWLVSGGVVVSSVLLLETFYKAFTDNPTSSEHFARQKVAAILSGKKTASAES